MPSQSKRNHPEKRSIKKQTALKKPHNERLALEINKLRKQICEKRKQLYTNLQQQYAKNITQQLINSDIFKRSNKIACYLAVNGEVNTNLIIETIWQQNKECYLPILTENRLQFCKYSENDELIPNQCGILEPIFTTEKHLAPEQLDLVIVPLVAFDNNNNRIGMGCGYYDRTFAFKKLTTTNKPCLVGIAYKFQQVTSLTQKSWDVQLDLIIS